MRSPLRAIAALLLAATALGGGPAPARAETCISPYIKGLQQREKVLYLWALPEETGGEDFLAVVDVDIASASYGRILERVKVGSTGNEAHHMGFTDDRTKIWAASLNSNRFFIFDVGTDPRHPKLLRTVDGVAELSGLSGPHTPYAIPGRMLVSMASGPDGTGPGGIAEFTNDGEFVASYPTRDNPYETVIKPEFNRMITSSWVPQATFMAPLSEWDPATFSRTMTVWDLKERRILQELPGDPIPLAARWLLAPGARVGYNISAGGDSLWQFRLRDDGLFDYREAADTGAGCGPGDLRQSPDDKWLYVSCRLSGEVQAWDVSDPDRIRLHDTAQGLVQVNMLHVTPDGKRIYATNSAISSIDHSPRYAMWLLYVGPDGRLKLDDQFRIDFARAPDGPARPHDMLLN
jgi:methanethiol oxidase